MKRVKTVLKAAFLLPALPTVLIALPSFALLIYAMTAEKCPPALAYAAYGLSAYATAISVSGIVRLTRTFPGLEHLPPVRALIAHPRGARLWHDISYRTQVSLYLSLAVNLAYVILKLGAGILYGSVWFLSLAGYYALLTVMRFSLARYVRRNVVGEDEAMEQRRCRVCGVLLLLMNQALTVMVVLMVRRNAGYSYPGVLIYVMAAYTFYMVVTAIRNLIVYRRFGSPVLSAVKAVSLTAALVSLLSLETAMLTRFDSGEDPAFRRIMTGATGAGICLVVLVTAIFMIVRANKRLARMENEPVKGGTQ